MSKETRPVARSSETDAIDAFLRRADAVAAQRSAGRLIFALDATMSRQPTWDMAQSVQARMFQTAASLGGLEVQLVYFRGFSECRASRFVSGGRGLAELMAKIACRGGSTQIVRVLRHAADEARRERLGVLVYAGDAMEENFDTLCQAAGEVALLGVKAFMFHEGEDSRAGTAFREIARLTGGAYAAFDVRAPDRLAALLAAAAAYAAGGFHGLASIARDNDPAARLLLSQLTP
jgi:hypothetical protein